MTEFSINVELTQGMTRLTISGNLPNQWRDTNVPEFFVSFESGSERKLIVLVRERGTWYDQVTQVAKTVTYLNYLTEGWADWWNPSYESPLTANEVMMIGQLINDHIVEMSRFIVVYNSAA